jgi:hypothetical protein
MGFFPLAQVWHLSFASHSHRHCPTHHQIEDVLDPQILLTDDSPSGPTIRNAPLAERHTPCPLLNYDTSRKPPLAHRESCSVQAVPRPGSAILPALPSHAFFALILIAPKNSPPATAV